MNEALSAGVRLRSAVSDVEVVVVRAPDGAIDLRCGGYPMRSLDAGLQPGAGPMPGFDGNVVLGKRYTDADGALEVLCTKAGEGSLSVGDELLVLKTAKPLPSSD